jgi:hypothetical protein
MPAAPQKTVDDKLKDAEALVRSKNHEIALLHKEVRSLTKSNDSAQRVYERIQELLSYVPDPPAWLEPIKSGASSRGVPVTIWSDWHYGEKITKAETGGVNYYNRAVAKKRIERLINTTVELAFDHMGDSKKEYPGIVVCLGGDMIGGDIHEELMATNEVSTQVAMCEVADLITAGLRRMADKFGRVFVPAVVGNHARGTIRPRFKGAVNTSNELVVYTMVKQALKDDSRIVMHIPAQTDANFRVYNHRFLLTHGDNMGVKGGDGIIGVIGPIMRGTFKMSNSESAIGNDFDTALICHYHQMLWLPKAIVNNALKGYDEYARLKLRAVPSQPSQALFFVHPKHGITARWEVYLEGRYKSKKADWCSWNWG